MDNPIKKRIDELGLSTHAVAKIIGIKQASVYRHYSGQRRLSADSIEAYSDKLQIKQKEMLKWNRFLKEKSRQRQTHCYC